MEKRKDFVTGGRKIFFLTIKFLTLRFFFLNATFESSLIRVLFLNFWWSLIPPTQWKNDLKPTKLQRHLSMQTLFWMISTMYNNQKRTLYEIDLVFVITCEKRKLFTLPSSVPSVIHRLWKEIILHSKPTLQAFRRSQA